MMKSLLAFVLLVATVVSALNLTEDEREQARLALQNPTLFEGDIMGIDPHDRNVIPPEQMRWTNARVPYIIDNSLAGQRNLILSAMQDYHVNTCLRFVPWDGQRNYIRMFLGHGCNSYIGMQTGYGQDLSLGKGCHYRGTIVHELGHALGLFHEQARSDRDHYLTIYWNNIQQGMESQFEILQPHQNLLLTVFDYNSIMIFGNYAFTKAHGEVTMGAKNGQKLTEPYEKQGMTPSDIQRIKKMYCC